MQAVSLPATAGWQWIMDGWALFKRQPMALFSWAMFVTLILIFATLTAPIGPLLFIALMPAITLVTLSITRHVADGRKLLPSMWIEPLKPKGLFKKLLILGVLYVGICLGVGLLVFLPFSGQLGEAMQILSETQDMTPLIETLQTPMLLFALFYFLFAALFWYSPVLIGWHGTPIGKSLFFSAIACWRNKWAFLVYGVAWAAIFLGADLLVGIVVSLGIPLDIAAALQLPFNVFLGSVLYASFYPTFIKVFNNKGILSQ
ncbi:BPSS1780 family membrane protein [Orrella daihaiensis]|uniref:Transmembrane protein n=1 Tax=Orrella daihaiensis TaxID=2782176 RepID=A0ABY4AGM0_9BURK|nr:BPSS1780 family membrane protein [Orrella daihaiensis]UOD49426.1 hypothetical protein DHf2319_07990 [Orrella daihaiensis]